MLTQMNSLTRVCAKSLRVVSIVYYILRNFKLIREVDEAARIITWAMAILILTSHIDIIVSTSSALVFQPKDFFVSLVKFEVL